MLWFEQTRRFPIVQMSHGGARIERIQLDKLDGMWNVKISFDLDEQQLGDIWYDVELARHSLNTVSFVARY